MVELTEGDVVGRGECMPNPRYGHSSAEVVAAVERIAPKLEDGLDRAALQRVLVPGPARNAIDCALWDLAAKRAGRRVWELAGLAPPQSLVTAYTLSLADPETMGQAARSQAHRPLLKLKVTGEGDVERVAAVRENAPQARLIVDANEAWRPERVASLSAELARLGVELIEQPVPAEEDACLADLDHPVPFCADESCHTAADLDGLVGRYDMINIKLDKTGGLTEALVLRRAARAAGLDVMVGCMVATSLAIAPAVLVAQGAEVVDLDGPLLLRRDRSPGLRFAGSTLYPPDPALWG